MEEIIYWLAGAMAVERVFGLLRGRGIDLKALCEQVKKLHEWHDVDVPGEPGQKIWWFRKSYADSMENLQVAIREQTKVMQGMWDEIKEMRRDVGDLKS